VGRREGFFLPRHSSMECWAEEGMVSPRSSLRGVFWAEQGVVSPRDSSVCGVCWAQEDVGAMSCVVQTHR